MGTGVPIFMGSPFLRDTGTYTPESTVCVFFKQGVAADITTYVIPAGFSSLELERILKTMTLYDTQEDTAYQNILSDLPCTSHVQAYKPVHAHFLY